MKQARFSLISPLALLLPPLILAVALLCPLVLAAKANAPEIVASGDCGVQGDNVTWKLDSAGTLTISGEGKMQTFQTSGAIWRQKSVKVKRAVIGNGVTNIGGWAFYDCDELASVEIPESVNLIGASSFSNCSALTEITIPGSVKEIGSTAFSNCTGLTNMMIPEGVESLGSSAFYGCKSLISVHIPASISAMRGANSDYGNPFPGCPLLSRITVAEENKNFYVEDGVLFSVGQTILFYYPNSKTERAYVMPDSVSEIASYAFDHCVHLEEIAFPDKLVTIGWYAFSNCKGLRNLAVPKNTKTIGAYAFYNCTALKDVSIPENVADVGAYAFSGCTGLTEITIPRMGFSHGIFLRCTNLHSVTVLDGAVVIGEEAFSNCSNLTEITLPSSITQINKNAFLDCSRLDSIYYAGPAAEWEAINFDKQGNEVILYHTNIYYNGSHDVIGREAETGPIIALTYAPAYDENRPFQGVVFTKDGSPFDTSQYRVSLWLYYSGYYPKPTYEKPYAEIEADGSFSIVYNTGGNDRKSRTIYLMLIPADYTPSASDGINGTLAKALDLVKVSRTPGSEAGEDGEAEEGTVTVTPFRTPPTPDGIAPPMPSGLLPVARDKIAVDVGFYTNGSAHGSALSADLIRQQLTAVSQFSDVVRFYSSGGELAKAYEIAHSMGFTVLGNAWLSKDKAANQAELDALIGNCNKGYCKIAIVGSEALLRGDLTAGELVEAIRYVRERLNDKTIPVTTGDSVDILLATPSVRNACNLLMPNCYPYWGGTAAAEARAHFTADMEALKAVSGGKEILVSETGWPTQGQGKGKAVAGEAEAAQYYAAVREWSLATNTQVLFFDAADEPWKVRDEGESGAHWGFLTKDLVLKDCYADLNPFRAAFSITSDSGPGGGAETVTLTNHTDQAAAVLFAAAAYDAGGHMVSCKMVAQSLGAGESVSLQVPSGTQGGGTTLKVFVLDGNTFQPLRSVWEAREDTR